MHTNDYFKYLLDDPPYLGKMIIVHKIGKSELAFNVYQPSYDENIQPDACRV
jgi:hypothetical protein